MASNGDIGKEITVLVFFDAWKAFQLLCEKYGRGEPVHTDEKKRQLCGKITSVFASVTVNDGSHADSCRICGYVTSGEFAKTGLQRRQVHYSGKQ